MNAHKLEASYAFSEGSDLWILKNEPNSIWWQKINFSCQYLLTENYFYSRKSTSTKSCLLLGTQDHFKNNWLLLWDHPNLSNFIPEIEKILQSLKVHSVRFFSDSQLLITQLEPRLLASSISITYIENT